MYLSATYVRVGVVLWLDVPAILRHVSVRHSKRAINKRDEDDYPEVGDASHLPPIKFQKPAPHKIFHRRHGSRLLLTTDCRCGLWFHNIYCLLVVASSPAIIL